MEYSLEQTTEIPTPFIALMMGKDEDEQQLIATTFLALDTQLQDVLVGEETVATISSWVTSGLLPQTHATALSKLIGMLALEDEVLIESVPGILEELGLTSSAALQVTQGIRQIIQPFLVEREVESLDSTVSAVPVPTPPQPRTQTQSRNTIDLRSKPTA